MNLGFTNMYLEPETLTHSGIDLPEMDTIEIPIEQSGIKDTSDENTDKKFPWWIIILAGGIYVLQR